MNQDIEDIIYGFLVVVALTGLILIIADFNIKDKESNTTETVSIEINKVEKSI
jgi:hypothetical protein